MIFPLTKTLFRQLTAIGLSLTFSIAALFPASSLASGSVPESSAPPFNIREWQLPEELGTVVELSLPESGEPKTPFVFYLEDAHVNPEAQRNLLDIIRLLQNQAGIQSVFLEGGEGRFDTVYFKSLPDSALKAALVDHYLNAGELSGPEAASLLGNEKTQFFGIETLSLYRQNKNEFLMAQDAVREDRSLQEKEKTLLARKKILNPALSDFFDQSRAFHENALDPLSYLSVLGRRAAPAVLARYPLIQTALQLAVREKALKSEVFQSAFSRWLRELEIKGPALFSQTDLKTFVQECQRVKTGETSPEYFMVWAESFSREKKYPLPLPVSLKEGQVSRQEYSRLKDPLFFEQMTALEEQIFEDSSKTGAEKAWLKEWRSLEILKKFSRLELSRTEWERYKKESFLLESVFRHSLRFYRLAETRDEGLWSRLNQKIGKTGAQNFILVTGGFHRPGVTRRLKEAGIPFAVVRPAIHHDQDRSRYLEVMRGQVSFREYQQGSRWEAFLKDYSLKALGKIPENERGAFLRAWRDQIIQKLAAEGAVDQAGRYTVYLEALSQGEEAFKLLRSSETAAGKLKEAWDRFLSAYWKKMPEVIQSESAGFLPSSSFALSPELSLIPSRLENRQLIVNDFFTGDLLPALPWNPEWQGTRVQELTFTARHYPEFLEAIDGKEDWSEEWTRKTYLISILQNLKDRLMIALQKTPAFPQENLNDLNPLIGHVIANALDSLFERIDQDEILPEKAVLKADVYVDRPTDHFYFVLQDNGTGIPESILRDWTAGRFKSLRHKDEDRFIGGLGNGVEDVLDTANQEGVEVTYLTRNGTQGFRFFQNRKGERTLLPASIETTGTILILKGRLFHDSGRLEARGDEPLKPGEMAKAPGVDPAKLQNFGMSISQLQLPRDQGIFETLKKTVLESEASPIKTSPFRKYVLKDKPNQVLTGVKEMLRFTPGNHNAPLKIIYLEAERQNFLTQDGYLKGVPLPRLEMRGALEDLKRLSEEITGEIQTVRRDLPEGMKGKNLDRQLEKGAAQIAGWFEKDDGRDFPSTDWRKFFVLLKSVSKMKRIRGNLQDTTRPLDPDQKRFQFAEGRMRRGIGIPIKIRERLFLLSEKLNRLITQGSKRFEAPLEIPETEREWLWPENNSIRTEMRWFSFALKGVFFAGSFFSALFQVAWWGTVNTVNFVNSVFEDAMTLFFNYDWYPVKWESRHDTFGRQLILFFGESAYGRLTLVQALAEKKNPNENEMDILRAFLFDHDGLVRAAAAESLGQKKDSLAIESLQILSQADPNLNVIQAANKALKQIGDSLGLDLRAEIREIPRGIKWIALISLTLLKGVWVLAVMVPVALVFILLKAAGLSFFVDMNAVTWEFKRQESGGRLYGPDPNQRLKQLSEITDRPVLNEEEAEILRAFLFDKDGSVRLEAARFLGEKRDMKAIADLQILADADSHDNVKAAAKKSLDQIKQAWMRRAEMRAEEQGKKLAGSLSVSQFKKILIVEDYPGTVEIYQEHVFIPEILGPEVHVVYSRDGAKAAEYCAAESFDLVVTDRGLPGISGDELVRRIRSHGNQTPIVVVSHQEKSGSLPNDNLVYVPKGDSFHRVLRGLLSTLRNQAAARTEWREAVQERIKREESNFAFKESEVLRKLFQLKDPDSRAVSEMLFGYGVSQDPALRPLVDKFAAEASALLHENDPVTPLYAPSALTEARRLFKIIQETKEKPWILFELDESMLDPGFEAEALRNLLRTAGGAALFHFQMIFVCENPAVQKSLYREMGKTGFQENIRIMGRTEAENLLADSSSPVFRIERSSSMRRNQKSLDTAKYADRTDVNYRGSFNVNALSEMLTAGLAAALSKQTAEWLVFHDQLAQVKDAQAREGFFLLMGLLTEQAENLRLIARSA